LLCTPSFIDGATKELLGAFSFIDGATEELLGDNIKLRVDTNQLLGGNIKLHVEANQLLVCVPTVFFHDLKPTWKETQNLFPQALSLLVSIQ